MAAPEGNNNASKNKLWSDTIRRALSGKQNADKLRKLAEKLIEMAMDGDVRAMKELGDRLEGKPVQALSNPDGKDLFPDVIKIIHE